MIEIALTPGILSDIVDASAIVEGYRNFMKGKREPAKRGMKSNLKRMIRGILPARILAMYEDKALRNVLPPPYMTFKRFYAMKVYLDGISQRQK
jgi:hypothetical protein